MSDPAPKTILVIDDSGVVRQLAAHLLRKDGHQVFEAANGREGLELALSLRPDLAICDINMPVLDGWGFVAEARACEALHTMPILMVTANQDRESSRRAMSTGADDYLTKPWKPAELRAAIRGLADKLTRHRAETERSLDRLRGAMLATVPHELRTPLTSIMGWTQLLMMRRHKVSDEQVGDMLQSIHTSATRLTRTIQRMLEWADLRASSSGLRGQRGSLDPGDTVLTMLQDSQVRAGLLASLPEGTPDEGPGTMGGHAVQVRMEPGRVMCHAEDFQHMVSELLANALRFSQPGLPVGITGRLLDGRYALEVANVGLAMSPDFVRQIGALAQSDRELHEQQGVGLGLALTQLRAQRNDVHFDMPRHDGQPTQVRLLLPLA